jgi:hypothetical protein
MVVTSLITSLDEGHIEQRPQFSRGFMATLLIPQRGPMLRCEKSAQMQCGGHGIKPIKGLLKKSIFALNFCHGL